MITDNELKTCLEIWKYRCGPHMVEGENGSGHIADENIYRMAEDSGMTDAAAGDFEHLSRCPVCMEKWAAWREAISAVEDDEAQQEAAPLMSYGLLRAAATPDDKEPVSSLSSCGRLRLSVAPPLDTGDRWIVILEVAGKTGEMLEGRHIRVRDAKGRILLDGKIEQGRMAQLWKTLPDFDLSTWTCIEKANEP